MLERPGTDPVVTAAGSDAGRPRKTAVLRAYKTDATIGTHQQVQCSVDKWVVLTVSSKK